MKTILINVKGRVQGVYFRAYTQKQAVKLGITGYVRNKHDGSVEVIARADQDNLDRLIKWCHKGPIMANVSKVLVSDHATAETFTRFEVR